MRLSGTRCGMATPIAQSSGDSGSGEFGVTLPGGNQVGVKAQYTVAHTVLILLVALLALWLLGGIVFRKIRM